MLLYKREIGFKNFSWAYKFASLFFISAIIVTVFHAAFLQGSWKTLLNLKYFFIGLMTYFPMYYWVKANLKIKGKDAVLALFDVFIIATSIATISGIIAIPLGFNILKMKPSCHPFRACGMYGMTITYGYNIALALSLFVGIYLLKLTETVTPKKRIFIWSLILINTLGQYLSYARGGLIAFVVSILTIIWFKNRKVFIVGATIVLIVLSGLIYASNFLKLDNHYLVPWSQPTNILRIHQVQTAWFAAQDNPWLGLGFRQFEGQSLDLKSKYQIPLLDGYKNWKGHAHNNFAEILVGLGFISFVLFFLWHLLWLLGTFKLNSLNNLFAPFVVCHLITGLFQSTIIDGENMFLIMFIFPIFEVIHKLEGDRINSKH